MALLPNFGVVVIGRNEGERLKRCLESMTGANRVIYVDSGSSDGSVCLARKMGADVINLDLSVPFTAARARNAGFRRLRERASELQFVQFIDGDCELQKDWPAQALGFLADRENVAAAFGRRRERFPQRSVYNWLCDREWDVPVGEVKACGGDVMARVSAIDAVGGYRESLIAGEEPEMCVRLRALGWRIWRIDAEMTLHDAAMLHFSQWWKRSIRGGYAFAEGAYLHGGRPERHWVREGRRSLVWGLLLPCLCLLLSLLWPPYGALSFLIFPAQLGRLSLRSEGNLRERLAVSFFQVIGKFAEAIGQLRFFTDLIFSRRASLIEYK